MARRAVVLAGGRGIRLRAVARGVPKPLVSVGGIPFICHALTKLEEIGIDIYILIRGCTLARYQDALKEFSPISYITTDTDVNKAVCSVPFASHEPFILLNGDCYPLMSFSQWLSFCNKGPRTVATDPMGRDVGMVIISQDTIQAGEVDCGRLADTVGKFVPFGASGVLQINTPEDLAQARDFFKHL